jgi:hypothetical protein
VRSRRISLNRFCRARDPMHRTAATEEYYRGAVTFRKQVGSGDRRHFRCGAHVGADAFSSMGKQTRLQAPCFRKQHRYALVPRIAAYCVESVIGSLLVRPNVYARSSATYLAIWKLIHARQQDCSPPARRNLPATRATIYWVMLPLSPASCRSSCPATCRGTMRARSQARRRYPRDTRRDRSAPIRRHREGNRLLWLRNRRR